MRAEFKKRENGHIVTIYEVIKEKEGEEITVPYIKADKLNAKSTFNGKLNDNHRRDFPESVRIFETGGNIIEGTSLDELSGMPKNIIQEYAHRNVHTIEDLASLDDMDIQKLPLGTKYSNAAKDYIDINNPETRKREADQLKADMKKEILAEIMDSPDAIKSIADGMGLAVSKKREKKEKEVVE